MKYAYNGILHRNEKEPLHSTFVCLTKNMNTKKYIPYNCMFMKFKIYGDRSQNSGPVCAKACETVVMHGRVSAAPGGPPHSAANHFFLLFGIQPGCELGWSTGITPRGGRQGSRQAQASHQLCQWHVPGVGGANTHPNIIPSPRVPQLSIGGKNRSLGVF